MQVFPGHLPRSHTIKPHVTWSCFMSSLIANKWLWTLKYYWRVEYFHLQNLEISIILSPNLRHSKPRIFQMLLSHNYKFLWITVPTRAVESESEGFSTWGVAVVEKFNDFDSGQTFCSPIVTVCATNVRKRHTGNLGSLTFHLACIHSGGDSRSAASLGLITQLMLSECNLSRPASLTFPFAFILVGIVVALWR